MTFNRKFAKQKAQELFDFLLFSQPLAILLSHQEMVKYIKTRLNTELWSFFRAIMGLNCKSPGNSSVVKENGMERLPSAKVSNNLKCSHCR